MFREAFANATGPPRRHRAGATSAHARRRSSRSSPGCCATTSARARRPGKIRRPTPPRRGARATRRPWRASRDRRVPRRNATPRSTRWPPPKRMAPRPSDEAREAVARPRETGGGVRGVRETAGTRARQPPRRRNPRGRLRPSAAAEFHTRRSRTGSPRPRRTTTSPSSTSPSLTSPRVARPAAAHRTNRGRRAHPRSAPLARDDRGAGARRRQGACGLGAALRQRRSTRRRAGERSAGHARGRRGSRERTSGPSACATATRS